MSIPTKQSLKEKYKITNGDFQVLTDLPSDAAVREKGFLVKVGEAFGAQEWMWRTWTGVVLAIIVIGPSFKTDVDYWQPKVIASVGGFYHYFRQLRWPVAPSDNQWTAFVPELVVPESQKVNASMDLLTLGSRIVPGVTQLATNLPIPVIGEIRYRYRERWLNRPPDQKQVSAPGTEREYLPLSQVVSFARGVGRLIEGTVPHLPYRFRVSILDHEFTVEVFEGDKPLDTFPQTVRHTFTSDGNSRTHLFLPITDAIKTNIVKSLLYENCYVGWAAIILGADDNLVKSAFLRPLHS